MLNMGEELPVASHAKRILTYGEHTVRLLTVAGSKPSKERGETHTPLHTSAHRALVTVSYLR